MNPIRTAAVAAAILGLAACGAFGPPREPPSVPSPAHYAAKDMVSRLPEADGAAQQIYAGAPVPQWWRAYDSDALDALVEEGLRNSPSLAAAQGALKAAQEGVRSQIGNSLYPRVDAGFDPSRQRALALPTLPQPTLLYNVFAAEVQTSYSFDFFGAAALADRALAAQVRQQAFQLEAVRRGLAANIVIGTIDSASLKEQVAAMETSVALAEQRARDVAARYQRGAVSRDDLSAAEQEAATAAAALPPLRSQALAMRHALAVLLGRAPDQAPDPLPLDSLHLPDSVPLSVASDLLHQRPDILAAEFALRASADQAGAAAAALFPSVTLSAAYGRGGFDWSTFTSPGGAIWSVGAALTQPLFHGGALAARRRQYRAAYEASAAQYKQTVLAAFQNVADTLVALEEDANGLAQASRAANAAHDLARDSEARYELGAAPLTHVLLARQQFQDARVQYLRARAARLADTAALFDSMGAPPGRAAALPHARSGDTPPTG
jgi:NodT family efflux transporter outer membrane factor (OMF) lipoprotein